MITDAFLIFMARSIFFMVMFVLVFAVMTPIVVMVMFFFLSATFLHRGSGRSHYNRCRRSRYGSRSRYMATIIASQSCARRAAYRCADYGAILSVKFFADGCARPAAYCAAHNRTPIYRKSHRTDRQQSQYQINRLPHNLTS